jgi:alkylation response protein AidB-like acyl-CoA dehydrogenase
MPMTFTEEQDEFRKSIRRFLEQKSSTADVRRLMETDEGYDPAVWQQMAGQLGLQGLALAEEYGGSGYGFIEQILVLEEMGRALLCAPYFSTVVLAGTALVQSVTTRRKGTCCLASPAARPSRRSRGWRTRPNGERDRCPRRRSGPAAATRSTVRRRSCSTGTPRR